MTKTEFEVANPAKPQFYKRLVRDIINLTCFRNLTATIQIRNMQLK